jgi:UDPglucose 6-dehydrogenase
MARAEELGAKQAVEFLKEVDAINLRARQRIIELVRKDLSEDLVGKKVAILGAAFKPDSDDVRDSPALDIAAQIQAAGAVVTVHDPKAIANAQKRFPALKFAEDINSTLKDAEIVLHLTEWKIYREIKPEQVKSLVKTAIMIDGRNALDRDAWRAAGWKFRALGRTDNE